MKTFTRILDHEADNAGWGLPELPMMLICIHRALVTAEVRSAMVRRQAVRSRNIGAKLDFRGSTVLS